MRHARQPAAQIAQQQAVADDDVPRAAQRREEALQARSRNRDAGFQRERDVRAVVLRDGQLRASAQERQNAPEQRALGSQRPVRHESHRRHRRGGRGGGARAVIRSPARRARAHCGRAPARRSRVIATSADVLRTHRFAGTAQRAGVEPMRRGRPRPRRTAAPWRVRAASGAGHASRAIPGTPAGTGCSRCRPPSRAAAAPIRKSRHG